MLTPRQTEVAKLVAKGMSNKAIARQIGIAYETVHWHIQEAAERIDIEGRPRHKLTLFIMNAP